MKLIVGLGNIGDEYKDTRHNAGFMVLDELLINLTKKAKFSHDKKMEVDVAKEKNLILIKPTTFMNNSGRAVRKVMDFYKLTIEDLIVIHDDLDIKLGEYKIQKAVGPKVHNGINSVEQGVGGKDFFRVRVGVDSRSETPFAGSGADYVLARMSSKEKELLKEVVNKIVYDLKEYIDSVK